MRIRSALFASVVTLAAFTACRGSRTYTFTRDNMTHGTMQGSGMASVAVVEDGAIDAEVVGAEHQLSWMQHAELPTGGKMAGLIVRLSKTDVIHVQLQDSDSITGPSATSPQPWARTSRDSGTVTFTHPTGGENGLTGRIEMRFTNGTIAAIRRAGWQPTGTDAMRLLLSNVTADELIAFRNVDQDASMHLAWQLSRRNADAQDYEAFVKVTAFDEQEVIKLITQGVDLRTTIEWYQMGNQASVDELIYCRRRGITPAVARSWQEAGASLSFEEIYWAKRRGVKPEHHIAWAEADCELDLDKLYWVRRRGITAEHHRVWAEAGKTLDLEQLQWARRHGLKPEHSRAWSEIGRDLSLEQIYNARRYGIKASLAGTWQELGYDLSVKQLSDLRRYGVKPDFAKRFLAPEYVRPTLDELKHYRRHGKKPEDVNKLRQPRRSR